MEYFYSKIWYWNMLWNGPKMLDNENKWSLDNKARLVAISLLTAISLEYGKSKAINWQIYEKVSLVVLKTLKYFDYINQF